MTPRPLSMLLFVVILLLPSASAAWPMEGGDARRSGTVTGAFPTGAVTLAWNATGHFTGVLVAPDGSVVGTGDPVTVWEADGTLRWSTRTMGPQPAFRARGPGALLSDGTIVVPGSLPSGAAAVVGYDPRNGSERFVTRDIVGTCDSVADGAVAVGRDDSFYVAQCGPGLVAFHKNGSVKWRQNVNAERVALDATSVYFVADAYTLPNGTSYNDAVVSLSQTDGSFLWAHRLLSARGDTVVGTDGSIYILDDLVVVALAPTNGEQKWATPIPRNYAFGIAPNGTLAMGGATVLSWISPADGSVLGTSPTRDGTRILVGTNVHVRGFGSQLSAIDTSGNLLWEVKGSAAEFQSNIAVGDGAIYVAEDGRLLAYQEEGRTTAPTPGTSPAPTGTPGLVAGTAPGPTRAGAAATPPGTGAADEGGGGIPGVAAPALLLALAAAAFLARRRSA